jgi:hypothetical protein
MGSSRFLTAEWLDLAILNFEINPAVLAPLVPLGTELDTWQGATLVSLVGFQFRNTRVLGIPIPFHRNFEEVNLRFYVRRKTSQGWRRAVVFVKEFAPRRAVAWTAAVFFGENYVTVPMRHRADPVNGDLHAARSVAYWWQHGGCENRLELTTAGPAHAAAAGSEEEFITEHHWGYSGGANRRTLEYRVEHPRWKVRTAREARFEGDVARLYGERFVESLTSPPASAFLADGSPVTVHRGMEIARC